MRGDAQFLYDTLTSNFEFTFCWHLKMRVAFAKVSRAPRGNWLRQYLALCASRRLLIILQGAKTRAAWWFWFSRRDAVLRAARLAVPGAAKAQREVRRQVPSRALEQRQAPPRPAALAPRTQRAGQIALDQGPQQLEYFNSVDFIVLNLDWF